MKEGKIEPKGAGHPDEDNMSGIEPFTLGMCYWRLVAQRWPRAQEKEMDMKWHSRAKDECCAGMHL